MNFDHLPPHVESSSFTWKPIYAELAPKLLEQEDHPGALILLLKRLQEQGYPVMSLQDSDAGRDSVPLSEIDPFTFYAGFNREISLENRREILRALKDEFGLQSPVPNDFDGVPLVNNMNVWFFGHGYKRASGDVMALWRFAREILTNEPGDIDQTLFNQILKISQVGLTKLTMGMFWMRPETFFATDKKNNDYVKQLGVKTVPKNARGYFHFLEEVKEKIGTDFADISYKAHLSAMEKAAERRFQMIKPGPQLSTAEKRAHNTVRRARQLDDGIDASSDVGVTEPALAYHKSNLDKKLLRLIPDDDLRYQWLQVVADAVALAAELSDVNWSLTFPQNGKYLRLNVALVEVITLGPEGVRLVVEEESLPANAIEAVRDVGGNVIDDPTLFTSVPGSKLCLEFPHTDIPLYSEFLRSSHHAYIRKASATRRGKNMWQRSHVPLLLDYLNALFELNLLQPAYLSQPNVDRDEPGRHIWLIATGLGGSEWETFLNDSSVRISYPGIGDLRGYQSREEMEKVLSHLLHNGEKNPFHDSLACHQFLHQVAVGDVVVAKAGTATVFGYGVVTGPYEYTSDDVSTPYSHRRSVEWKKTGTWQITRERKLVTKTLTEISKNRELVTYLEGLIEANLAPQNNPPSLISNPSTSYWWLNCNPRIWDVAGLRPGEKHSYTAFNERGNKRRIFEYFEQVRVGDLLIGYETTPKKRVSSLLRIIQPLHEADGYLRFVFEKIADASKEIRWEELIADEFLQNSEPVRNNQGSLFRLGSEEFEKISALADFSKMKTIELKSPVPDDLAPIITAEDVAERLLIAPKEVVQWNDALKRKGQIIFYGPPGTGKTFAAREFARHLIGGGRGFIETVQFHPAYAYEDFMQGIRPVAMENGTFSYTMVPGVFMNFCRQAEECGDDLCVLILDEINRANLSRVFGELMYLMEYRDQSVRLAGNGQEFRIPANVRIIGTMNTADRSIALVDHALRRRFAFIELRPEYGVLRNWHRSNDTGFNADGLCTLLERLNGAINDPHYEVGISFFLLRDIADQIEQIWRMEIEPYLQEYFLGRPDWKKQFGWENVREKITG